MDGCRLSLSLALASADIHCSKKRWSLISSQVVATSDTEQGVIWGFGDRDTEGQQPHFSQVVHSSKTVSQLVGKQFVSKITQNARSCMWGSEQSDHGLACPGPGGIPISY